MILLIKKNNNDLNVLCQVTLDQLYALEVLEDSLIYTVPTCVPTIEARVDQVINVLHDTVTPLLTHNYSTISNLSSVLDSASEGQGTKASEILHDLHIHGYFHIMVIF